MENFFPALHFQSVCVPCFEVGLLKTAYVRVLFLYPFSQSLSFDWGIQPIYVKVITDKYDPIAELHSLYSVDPVSSLTYLM